ncbi:hypothetical protein [Hyphomicrobium sp. DY-1]|uniref:hypothetical protein n=1 Tax=Hyphomicrobium sp. DY-1 TaxID=3075650 RepID=UPI0039C01B64
MKDMSLPMSPEKALNTFRDLTNGERSLEKPVDILFAIKDAFEQELSSDFDE